MTTIIAKHGQTYTLADDDLIDFGTFLKNEVGDPAPKKGKFAFRWGTASICYITNARRLYPASGPVYGAKAAPVVVTPPPVVTPPTPPATDVIANADGSIYARAGSTIVGINDSGCLNSVAPLPADWPRTKYNSGAERETAGLQIAGTEYVQVNAVFQGAMVTQGSMKTRQHSSSTGTDVLKGTNAGLRWQGSNAGVKVDQTVALSEGKLAYTVTLANTGNEPITRYDFWGDFNPSDSNAKLSATAREARQGTVAIKSTDARAIFYVTPGIDIRPTTGLPIKTVPQAPKAMDRSIAVGFLLDIAPGASETVTFEVVKA